MDHFIDPAAGVYCLCPRQPFRPRCPLPTQTDCYFAHRHMDIYKRYPDCHSISNSNRHSYTGTDKYGYAYRYSIDHKYAYDDTYGDRNAYLYTVTQFYSSSH
jgi:hypothetical protein